MVMSIGWNPQYDNDARTAEVHILHDYNQDFYAKEMRVVMLGWIRPEYKYASFGKHAPSLLPRPFPFWPAPPLTRRRRWRLRPLADALIKDINFDKEVAAASAARPAYKAFADDAFFTKPSTLAPPESDPSLPRVQPATIV